MLGLGERFFYQGMSLVGYFLQKEKTVESYVVSVEVSNDIWIWICRQNGIGSLSIDQDAGAQQDFGSRLLEDIALSTYYSIYFLKFLITFNTSHAHFPTILGIIDTPSNLKLVKV